MNKMGNIQHSTFNTQGSIRPWGGNPWMFGVECRVLNVLLYETGGRP